MDKLYDNALNELHEIEAHGINANNLDAAYKLASLAKNILKICKLEDEQMSDRYEAKRDREFSRPSTAIIRYGGRGDDRMPLRGGSFSSGKYDRMYDRLYRVEDGMDAYLAGKDRYYAGESNQSMAEGLEKMMYAITTLIETAMDAAETPEEKEIIRKHVMSIKNI